MLINFHCRTQRIEMRKPIVLPFQLHVTLSLARLSNEIAIVRRLETWGPENGFLDSWPIIAVFAFSRD